MKPEMRDMAGLYAVGALSDQEAAEFEAYLATSPEARAEVEEFLATTARLAEAEASAPPAGMKDRVLAEVAETRQEPPIVSALSSSRARWRRVVPYTAAAAVVLIAVLGIATVRLGGQVSDLEADQAVLTAADAVTVELAGTDGSLSVVWSADEDRLLVIGAGVPAAGEGMTYELWQVTSSGFEPLALFEPGDDGSVFESVGSPAVVQGEVVSLAVTVEVDGGVDEPTGTPVFVTT